MWTASYLRPCLARCAKTPEAEAERRRDPPPAVAPVERHPRPDCDHPHSGNTRILTFGPLTEGEVVDLVTVGGEPLGQVPVPALGAADGVRIDAVVDDADPHAPKSLALWPRRAGVRDGAGIPARVHDKL